MCSVKLFPNLEAALNGVFNRVLTTLNLGYNSIRVEGAKAIADSLKSGMAVLTDLDLGGNSIGVEGAKAIADSLKSGMAVLTNLNLNANEIGDEGAKCRIRV